MSPQMGLDTKIYWLTDRQSQCTFDFDFDARQFSRVLDSRQPRKVLSEFKTLSVNNIWSDLKR
jgi:hypothetical protein